MKGVNFGRVVLGGFVAGILINISETVLNLEVVKNDFEVAMKALGKNMPQGASAMVLWMIFGFTVGIAAVWLYAAIRPRYGAGPGTAVRAGVAVWLLVYLLSAIGMYNMGLFPGKVLTITAAWSLAETIIATMIGAWIYREDPATAPA